MSAAGAPALSVIVPAFNEEASLETAVLSLDRSFRALGARAEIIVVDDGSKDRTAEIADRLARELPGVSACHQSNQGIGGAIRTGAARATAPRLMVWPADMPAEAADLAPYLQALDRADVVVGCRRRRLGYNPLMRWNAWFYRYLVAALFGLRLRDVNWIHVYRRDQFARIVLRQRGIPMLVEALVRLRDLGASFVEVEVDMKPRTTGVSSAARPRVMWRTLRGLFAFWIAWRREKRPPSGAGPASA